MRLESNWKFKSLDNLEKVKWDKPHFESKLVRTIHRLRKVPLNEFGVEDLRIMIGQNVGLKFLVPLAIEQLQSDLFVEGDLFEGDLLQAVLDVEASFWTDNGELWTTMNTLISDKIELLDTEGIKYLDFQSLKV